MKKQVNIVKAAGIVSIFTLLSRIFGLVRDIVIATIFPKAATDAFFVAFTVPNVLRRLLAEGALTISFIPVFTDYLKKDSQESLDFVSSAFTVTAVVVSVVSLIGVLISPLLVWMFAAGFRNDPVKFANTVNLTRIMFPYILFVSLMALSMGVLNTLGHFVMPAAAPVFLNLTLIASGISAPFLGRWIGISPVFILAWGVLLGGVVQFLVQLPPMVKRKYRPSFKPNFKHPGVRKVMLLMAPALFGLAIYQINVILSRLLASFLESGANSYLYYSQRLIEFPMGVFAVAIATAAMPNLSDHASEGQLDNLKKTLRSSMELTFFVILPSMVGLLVISIPIVSVFFQRGRFDYAMTVETSKSLIAFAAGLPAMAIARQVVPAFYAMKDSKTPVISSTIALIAYIISGLTLMWPMSHAGLALAISISAWVNAMTLLFMFRKKTGSLGAAEMLNPVLKTVLASLLMGAVSWGGCRFGNWQLGGNNIRNVAVLGSTVTISGIAYLGFSIILGMNHGVKILSTVKRKLGLKKS
ncbi:MAG: murein biosynthesis integral membrane protein MurJ [Deltaproteobacteria bacterium]|nr:murein biosynthesis integral membrane protein MurJ [Deltaproteobacteria bacterium]